MRNRAAVHPVFEVLVGAYRQPGDARHVVGVEFLDCFYGFLDGVVAGLEEGYGFAFLFGFSLPGVDARTLEEVGACDEFSVEELLCDALCCLLVRMGGVEYGVGHGKKWE